MGGIDAGISEVSSKYYGSWVEYGVFSVNPNEIAGSGAGLRGGDISSAKADWSKLTFTNTTATLAGYAGGYGSLSVSTSRNYFANLPATNPAAPPLSGSVDMASLASGIYDATSGVSLYGAVGTGKSIILRTAGTVTIADSITIPNSYTSVSDISQVVIVAQDINITGGASDKTVDAWLLAAGDINTCAEKAVADPLTASDCPSRLTVNGPVIADKLYLRRTAGAEYNAPQDPAEVFNLRASSYLWIYNYANAKERTQTTFVRELPPRF
jgi:hypothetical protein